MKIAGIDPSIKCTAVVTADLDDKFDIVSLKLQAYNPTLKRCFNEGIIDVRHTGPGYAGKYLYEREDIAWANVSEFISGCEHVGIEDFAYDAKGNSSSIFQLAEHIGFIRKGIFDLRIPMYRYSPISIKKFGSDNPHADKIIMTRAFRNRYPEYCPEWFCEFVSSHSESDPIGDISDAFWMMEALRLSLKHKAGHPIPKWASANLMKSASKNTTALIDIIPEIKK